jgi:hypothetical protein
MAATESTTTSESNAIVRFIDLSPLTLKCGSQNGPQRHVSLQAASFAMHVGSGLDTENLEKDVSIRCGRNNVFRRCCGNGCRWGRCESWNGRQERRPACLLFGLGSGLNQSRRPAVAATILQAAGASAVMMHGTARAHGIHPHVTFGCRSHVRCRHDAASEAGEGRLRGEHRDKRNRDDLEELLHPLRKNIRLRGRGTVMQITDEAPTGTPVAS